MKPPDQQVARLLLGDLRQPGWPTAFADNYFDAVLCDPPYGLSQDGRARNWDDLSGKLSGFMGKEWDAAVPGRTFWEEVLRVVKPGAPVFAFGGTRTYHRLACAIEDAGFQIRDSIGVPGFAWIYGQDFPKSLNISKAIDQRAGAERKVIGRSRHSATRTASSWQAADEPPHGMVGRAEGERLVTAPSTVEAAAWDGYGTALKPAWEPIVYAQAPLSGSYAENAFRWGVAGLNVQGGRIGTNARINGAASSSSLSRKSRVEMGYRNDAGRGPGAYASETIGRWPSNLVLVHHPDCNGSCVLDCPVAALDHQSGPLQSGFMAAGTQREGIGWHGGLGATVLHDTHGDFGGASRFFYQAKVSAAERSGSKHPTLKPIDLCAYLAKLILPPAREGEPRCLFVPFCGAGSEIIGALRAGWECVIGIDSDPASLEDARRRITDDRPLFNSVAVETLEGTA